MAWPGSLPDVSSFLTSHAAKHGICFSGGFGCVLLATLCLAATPPASISFTHE